MEQCNLHNQRVGEMRCESRFCTWFWSRRVVSLSVKWEISHLRYCISLLWFVIKDWSAMKSKNCWWTIKVKESNIRWSANMILEEKSTKSVSFADLILEQKKQGYRHHAMKKYHTWYLAWFYWDMQSLKIPVQALLQCIHKIVDEQGSWNERPESKGKYKYQEQNWRSLSADGIWDHYLYKEFRSWIPCILVIGFETSINDWARWARRCIMQWEMHS